MMTMISEITDDATIDWLLEEENPSVRYFTLTRLLGRTAGDPDVIKTRNDIMRTGIVPKILERQHPDGFWSVEKRFYLDKYGGTVWQLIILAELGADPADVRIRKACEFVLANAQDRESYGFAINRSGKEGGGRHGEVVPCLTGNMVFSLIRLGFLDDERVQKGIEWICRYQRSDDGVDGVRAGWPYDRYEICFGRHTCHMGVVKALKALAAVPEDRRSGPIAAKIGELAEFLLIHHIYKKSHDLDRISKPGWLKPGFPLMYQTDILEILGILTDLGYRDPRMDEAVDIIRAKRNSEKRWVLENTFNGKWLEDIETRGRNSKWITLRAAGVLRKRADG